MFASLDESLGYIQLPVQPLTCGIYIRDQIPLHVFITGPILKGLIFFRILVHSFSGILFHVVPLPFLLLLLLGVLYKH